MKSIILYFTVGSIAILGSYSASYGYFKGGTETKSVVAGNDLVEPSLLISAYAPPISDPDQRDLSAVEKVLQYGVDAAARDPEFVVASREIDLTPTYSLGDGPAVDLPVETFTTEAKTETATFPELGRIAVPTKRPENTSSFNSERTAKAVAKRKVTRSKPATAARNTLKKSAKKISGKGKKLVLAKATAAKKKRRKITRKVWFTGAFR